MRRFLTASFVATALAVALACDPFPDVDALGGGDGAAPSTAGEGGIGGGDGAGGPAAGDAGSDADAGGRFCSQATHAFCADLDGNEALATIWTEVEPGVAVVSSPTKSGTGALHMTLPAVPSGGTADMVVKKKLDVPAANVTVEFDAYWVEPAWKQSDGNVFIASVDDGDAHFFLWVDSGDPLGITSNSPGAYGKRADTTGLAASAWTHVVFVMTPLSTKAEVLSLGTPPVVAVSQTAPMTAGSTKGITLTLGLFVSNPPTPPFEIYFDNITVDLSN
jgi:hypothetical protein